MSMSESIRKYAAKHPKAKANAIAEALGMKSTYVHTVLWNARKQRNKELLTDLTPGLKFLDGRAQANKPNWETVSLSSSSVPLFKDTVTNTSEERMMEIEYLATKGQADTHHDPVNQPAHYTVGGIETIDFIDAKKLNYNLGNVVKYITRADHKGNKLEDLRKAQWYLAREINSTK